MIWSAKLSAWLVTPFDDVQKGLQSDTFLCGGRINQAAQILPPDIVQKNKVVFECLEAWMSFRDAPDHTRLRRPLSRTFTARRVAVLETQIESIVNQLLDEWPMDRAFDPISTFTFRLPAMVICQLLGIPFEKLKDLQRWSRGIGNLSAAGVMTTEAADLARIAITEATTYLETLLQDKQRSPCDDLLSNLIELDGEDGALSRPEIIALTIQLFYAGFETTEGLIGNALNVLLKNRDYYRQLRDDRIFSELVTEETLRFDNSIQRQTRIASESIELYGCNIEQGDYVFFLIGAANRDHRRFVEPDLYSPYRADLGNVSFGYGAHFCLGAHLARLETKIALQIIAKRFPDLKQIGNPEYGELLALRKPKKMLLIAN